MGYSRLHATEKCTPDTQPAIQNRGGRTVGHPEAEPCRYSLKLGGGHSWHRLGTKGKWEQNVHSPGIRATPGAALKYRPDSRQLSPMFCERTVRL